MVHVLLVQRAGQTTRSLARIWGTSGSGTRPRAVGGLTQHLPCMGGCVSRDGGPADDQTPANMASSIYYVEDVFEDEDEENDILPHISDREGVSSYPPRSSRQLIRVLCCVCVCMYLIYLFSVLLPMPADTAAHEMALLHSVLPNSAGWLLLWLLTFLTDSWNMLSFRSERTFSSHAATFTAVQHESRLA